MSFEELLKQAGLQDYSQYFSSDTGNIASELGLKGFQGQEFGKYFQPFDQEKLLEAQGEIEQNQATRTEFLEGNYQSSFRGLGQQLGQATQQIGQAAGQAGFSGSGSTAKQISESRKMAGQSLQDLMQKREQGLYGIEQQRGTEMAGLTGQLQSYLQGTFARGERLSRLDPNDKDYLVEKNKELMDKFRSLSGFANQSNQNQKETKPSDRAGFYEGQLSQGGNYIFTNGQWIER